MKLMEQYGVVRVVLAAGLVSLAVLAGCGDDGGGATEEDVDQAIYESETSLNRFVEQICGCEYDAGTAAYNTCIDNVKQDLGGTSTSTCEREAAICHADNSVEVSECYTEANNALVDCLSGCVDMSSTAGQRCGEEYQRAEHDCEQKMSYGLERDMEKCEQQGSIGQCSD